MSEPLTTLKIELVSEDASYHNSLGWYNKATGEAGILFRDTNDDGSHPAAQDGDFVLLQVSQADLDAGNIGFFLIPDGAAENAASLFNNPLRFQTDSHGDGVIVVDRPHGPDTSFDSADNQLLFSDFNLNKNNIDYMSGQVGPVGNKFGLQSDGPDGILGIMAWDDQVLKTGNKGSDRDFNDVVFNVTRVNANTPPTVDVAHFTVAENSANGMAVGVAVAHDPDVGQSLTYAITAGNAAGAFTIDAATGAIKVADPTKLDFEDAAKKHYVLTVQATDSQGATGAAQITIDVGDVNEAPVVPDGNLSVLEGAANGTVVGAAAASDPDGDQVSWSIVGGNDDGAFAVDADSGQITVADGTKLDHESEATRQLILRASDGSLHDDATITIAIGDVANGQAIDGYVAGATVFADADGDGKLDSGELSTTTDNQGNFELNSAGSPLVMVGGVDIATGLPFEGSLRAPDGATVITPLTTLVMAVAAAGGLTAADAQVALATALGLPPGTDFASLDPIAATAGGDPTGAAAFAAASEILNTVSMGAGLIDGAGDGVDFHGAADAMFASLAQAVLDANQASTPLDLSDAALLQAVIGDAAVEVGLDAGDVAGTAAAAAQAIADSNQAVEDALTNAGSPDELLTQVTAASIVAQGAASDAMAAAGASGDPSGLDAFTGGNLDQQIQDAEQQVGNTTGTFVVGTGGADTPLLTEMADAYDGQGGSDFIAGLGGSDQLIGGEGDDTIEGDAGNDVIQGGVGEDTYLHSGTAADGEDVVQTGDNGVDHVVFTTADLYDLTYERDGNDLVIGAYLADSDDFDGSLRIQDHYAGAAIADVTIDTAGYNLDYGTDPDAARFVFVTDMTAGTDQADYAEVLLGTEAGEVVSGGGGYYDALFGNGGNDTIESGDGGGANMRGGTGDDSIVGGSGDDLLRGDQGDDTLDGGGGFDVARYNNASGGVIVDLAAGTAHQADGTGDSGHDQLIGIEGVRGSAFDDTLHGDSGGNLLRGTGGEDTYLHSGTLADGYDLVITGENGLDHVVFTTPGLYDLDYWRDGEDLVVGAYLPDADTLDGSVRVQGHYAGGAIADVTIDTADYNLYYGTHAEAAHFVFVTDMTAGTDQADHTEILLGTDDGEVIDGGGGYYDALYGFGGDDTIQGGDDGHDNIRGGEGNDSIIAGGGNDQVRGDEGDDTLDGGDGNDLVRYDRNTTGGVVVDLEAGVANQADGSGNSGHDRLLSIENVRGSSFDDTLAGSDGNNEIDGRAGNDLLTGGAGDDTLIGGAGEDTYLHSGTAADGDDVVQTGDDGVDHVVFTTADLYDLNYERDGNDLVIGPYLADTDGFDGSLRIQDHYAGAAIADVTIDTAGYNLDYGTDPDAARFVFVADMTAGTDQADYTEVLLGTEAGEVVSGGGGYYDALYGNGGNDTITSGDDGTAFIRGGEGDDSIVSGAGSDQLRGDQGNDTLDGGDGFDQVRYNNASGGVIVDLAMGTADQADGTGDSGHDQLVGIEAARGSAFDDTLVGDGGGNVLRGLGGNDVLEGGGSGDLMQGDAGEDTYLHSGTAADGQDLVVTGENGLDHVVFTTPDLYDLDYFRNGDNLGIAAIEPGQTVWDASLQIQNHYAGGAMADVTIDTADYNLIYGTNAEAARFVFVTDMTAGTDQADHAEVLLGTEDGEIINGGGGYYDALYGNGGNDTIYGGDDGFDNLRGGEGDDSIIAGGGNDQVRGNEGDDTLDGGDGIDLVRYDRGTTGGVVVDLAAGTADDADGSGNSGHDVLLNIENVRGSNFDDTISGDGGSNQLDGRDGNDILIGGGGGDRFIGGGGDDSIVGGSGADTFQFDLASPAGNDTVSNFDRSVDVLSFNDVVDQGAPGLDLDDLTAAISGITDNGLGGNVVVGFDNGASITFAGVGTGSIASIQDLVDDPNSQIAVA